MNKNTKHNEATILGVCKLLFAFCLVFSISYLGFVRDVHAQTLGVSISPPIDEIMIMPGKEVSRSFTITNDGNDGMASIYIIPFRADGENGNILLDEKNAVTTSSPYASWFTLLSPVGTFGEKFYIPGGGRQEIAIKISPTEDAPEKDYYFTLLYELDNDVPGTITPIGPVNQARIGANIILSITKDGNPGKKLSISDFTAPFLLDSLGKLKFDVKLTNSSFYFSKANGYISIKPMLGKAEKLLLAPLNVITNSSRNIPCISGEEIVPCLYPHKVLIGIYKSTLSVNPEENGNVVTKEIVTIAFPFSLILGGALIFMTYRMIRMSRIKTINTIDKSFHRSNNV